MVLVLTRWDPSSARVNLGGREHCVIKVCHFSVCEILQIENTSVICIELTLHDDDISDINECLQSPCVHGQCSDTLGSYKCTCDVGWTGTNCQTGIIYTYLSRDSLRLNLKRQNKPSNRLQFFIHKDFDKYFKKIISSILLLCKVLFYF